MTRSVKSRILALLLGAAGIALAGATAAAAQEQGMLQHPLTRQVSLDSSVAETESANFLSISAPSTSAMTSSSPGVLVPWPVEIQNDDLGAYRTTISSFSLLRKSNVVRENNFAARVETASPNCSDNGFLKISQESLKKRLCVSEPQSPGSIITASATFVPASGASGGSMSR